jgi:hypothetical protein
VSKGGRQLPGHEFSRVSLRLATVVSYRASALSTVPQAVGPRFLGRAALGRRSVSTLKRLMASSLLHKRRYPDNRQTEVPLAAAVSISSREGPGTLEPLSHLHAIKLGMPRP